MKSVRGVSSKRVFPPGKRNLGMYKGGRQESRDETVEAGEGGSSGMGVGGCWSDEKVPLNMETRLQ